jgi:hypothetical protein
LLIVVDKEKRFVFPDRPPKAAPELVEVVRILRRADSVVGERIGVHALVAIKLKNRTMKFVGSDFVVTLMAPPEARPISAGNELALT